MNSSQETISRLKFIGKLQKGEKINTHAMIIQPDTWYASFSRTFLCRDNRSNTLKLVREVVDNSFKLLFSYRESENEPEKILYGLLITDLTNATIGLGNLKSTYILDTKFCCDIETIISEITARLSNYTLPENDIFADSKE